MALQVKLVHSLARHYGVPFEPSLARPLLSGTGLGGLAASFATATYATGQVFIRHFEAGGDLSNFEPQQAKALLRQELQTRAEEAAATPPQAPAGADAARPTAPAAPARLEDIHGIGPTYAARLRAAGIEDFAGLAALPPEQLKTIIGRAVSVRAVRAWIVQAAELAQSQV